MPPRFGAIARAPRHLQRQGKKELDRCHVPDDLVPRASLSPRAPLPKRLCPLLRLMPTTSRASTRRLLPPLNRTATTAAPEAPTPSTAASAIQTVAWPGRARKQDPG